jgi:hypothetical protein
VSKSRTCLSRRANPAEIGYNAGSAERGPTELASDGILDGPTTGIRPQGGELGDVRRRPMSQRRQPSRRGMAKVLSRMCMSLDVLVAHPDDNRARRPENEVQER